MSGIHQLEGVVKHYEWGGTTLIPSILNDANSSKLPYAEYWLGTHHSGIAKIKVNTDWEPLTHYLSEIPFLLKVLDVKEMLSIQVHPTKEKAESGFAKENIAGIPLTAVERNYKDANHKPELMVALSDFWLLHGFKPAHQLTATIQNTLPLRELEPILAKGGYGGLYRWVMEMPQQEVNRILGPLVGHPQPQGSDSKSHEDFWVYRACRNYCKDGNIDRGIFSIYFLNLVHLNKGEAIFQDAGVPHAYLEGHNIEIMSNSDNVLRGGLTNKNVDVVELLKNVSCVPTEPDIILPVPVSQFESLYPSPATEFQLSNISLEADNEYSWKPTAAEILILVSGGMTIKRNGSEIVLKTGSPAALIFPGYAVNCIATQGAIFFRATLPDYSR